VQRKPQAYSIAGERSAPAPAKVLCTRRRKIYASQKFYAPVGCKNPSRRQPMGAKDRIVSQEASRENPEPVLQGHSPSKNQRSPPMKNP